MLNRIIGKPNNWWLNLRRGSGVSVYGDNDVSASKFFFFISGPRNDARTHPLRLDDDVGRRTFAFWSALEMMRAYSLRGLLYLKDNNRDHI